jgi:hypothetical protein
MLHANYMYMCNALTSFIGLTISCSFYVNFEGNEISYVISEVLTTLTVTSIILWVT